MGPTKERLFFGPAGNSFCDDSPPSPTFVPGHNPPRIMQNPERPAYCQPCQKPTNHQIRYRSDPDFVGRVLVCENCEQGILEPLGPGRVAKTVDKPTSHVAP